MLAISLPVMSTSTNLSFTSGIKTKEEKNKFHQYVEPECPNWYYCCVWVHKWLPSPATGQKLTSSCWYSYIYQCQMWLCTTEFRLFNKLASCEGFHYYTERHESPRKMRLTKKIAASMPA